MLQTGAVPFVGCVRRWMASSRISPQVQMLGSRGARVFRHGRATARVRAAVAYGSSHVGEALFAAGQEMYEDVRRGVALPICSNYFPLRRVLGSRKSLLARLRSPNLRRLTENRQSRLSGLLMAS